MRIKILTILMLCCISAAWAGNGDGSKDTPYSGEWEATELVPMLKAGDYLAYDCVLNNGSITVYDSRLMIRLAYNWSKWVVADPIDDTPFRTYSVGCDYSSISTFEDRQSHVFQIKEVELKGEGKATIKGHYSGYYFADDDPQGKPLTERASVYVDSIGKVCVHNVQEFMDAVERYSSDSNTVIQIMNDIDMTEYIQPRYYNGDGKLYTTNFRAQLCGYYNRKYADGEFVRDEDGNIEVHTFELSHLREALFETCNKANIQGIKITDTDLADIVAFTAHKICKVAKDTEFTDVSIVGCRYEDESILKDMPLGIGFLYNLSVGEHAGHVATEMDGCKLKRVDVIGSTLFFRGKGVGNIAGYAKNTTFDNCFIDAATSLFVEKETNAYAGGIVGECEKCIFTDCVNMSHVCGSETADNVGGICGLSTQCSFEGCYNGGALAQTTKDTWAMTTIKTNWKIVSSVKSVYGLSTSLGKCREAIINTEIAMNNFYNTTNVEFLERSLELLEIARGTETFVVLSQLISAGLSAYALYSLTSSIIIALNGPDEMGGISAAAYGCTFNRCMNAGGIFCSDAYAGGIVGYAKYDGDTQTEITNCINTGYVQGDEQTGGIVGAMKEGKISYCLNTGTIDCRDNSTRSPICGDPDGTSVKDCFVTTHGVVAAGQTSVTLHDVMSGRVACELNRISGTKDFCQIVGRQPYPTLFGSKAVSDSDIREDIDTIFRVSDYMDFANALFNQYAHIELLNDIDFHGNFFSVYREITPFYGSIDGKGKKLKNISANISDSGYDNKVYDGKNYTALIGVASNATFKDLTLDSCSIKAPYDVAGLVAVSIGCKYENVKLYDNTSISAKARVGGLVCESKNDEFINCGVGYDCDISGGVLNSGIYSEVGGIAYDAKGSKFIDCYNSGNVHGLWGHVGGIVAYCMNCDFIHCTNNIHGYVYEERKSSTADKGVSPNHIGGIASYATKSNFYKCTNYGKVEGQGWQNGGIVGYGSGVKINSCFNSNFSSDLAFPENNITSGSIIGQAVDNSLVVNCAAECINNSTCKFPIIGTGADMHSDSGNNYRQGDSVGEAFNEWEMWATKYDFYNGRVCYWLNNGWYDNDSAWHQSRSELNLSNQGSPTTFSDVINDVTWQHVFRISTPKELKDFAEHVNSGNQFACAYLQNDIDMAGVSDFTPIGKNEAGKHYRGIFDGRGHTIKNLVVSSDKPVGLFGAVHAHADIRNVIIGEGCRFANTGEGNEGAGGIVGRAAIGWNWGHAHIENCGSYADIKVSRHGGGILGRVSTNGGPHIRVVVNNCFSMGTVTADNGNSALLCGYMKNDGAVSNCWSGGQLRTTKSGVYPFSIENKVGCWEVLVGYDLGMMPVTNSYVVNPSENVDMWNPLNSHAHQDGVEILGNIDMTSGTLAHYLNGNINDATTPMDWQQNIGTDTHPTFGSKGVYHTRNVSNEYGTLCLPYPVMSDDSIRYYTFSEATVSDDKVELRFVHAEDMIPAGAPVLFRVRNIGENSFLDADGGLNTWSWAKAPVAPAIATWSLWGTYMNRVFSDPYAKGIYYVSDGAVKNAETTVIAPFHAFFSGPDIDELHNAGITEVCITIDGEGGETTALELVGDDLVPMQNGKVYTIMGTETGSSYRSIVIRNGKKYITK